MVYVKIRLGVMGSEDSVRVIEKIVADYPQFVCRPFVNGDREQVIPLLREHEPEIDMWLLPGRMAYVIATEWGGVTKPMFNLPYKGSSLYRTLCQIFYTQKIQMNDISFESVLLEDLQQIFNELGIVEKPIYVKPFKLGQTEDESVEFHYRLWQNGSTKAAVTGTGNVKQRLREMGVPVFRILPARADVEAALNMILRVWEMQFIRDAQIAVQIFELDVFVAGKEFYSTDEMYAMEMKLTQKLILYAKTVQGSLKEAGPGRFAVFTTRGMLGASTREFSAIPDSEELCQLSENMIACGIGIGRSAYEAEFYAAKALLHAKEYGKGSWVVFFDDKTIVGPLGKTEQLQYSYAEDALRGISEATAISTATLSKISAIVDRLRSTDIGAHDLAKYMQIMPRSARRILAKLEQYGYAEPIGEDSPNPRGRPRKIYRIKLGHE